MTQQYDYGHWQHKYSPDPVETIQLYSKTFSISPMVSYGVSFVSSESYQYTPFVIGVLYAIVCSIQLWHKIKVETHQILILPHKKQFF